jgi:hypothetical protein
VLRCGLPLFGLLGCGRVAFDERGDAQTNADDVGMVADDATIDTPPGSVTVTLGEAPGTDIQGVTLDTAMSSIAATFNFGVSESFQVGSQWTALLRFDLTAIPSTATVIDARLRLGVTADATGDTITLHPVIEEWDEGTANGAIGTASFFERRSGMLWLGPGATGSSRSGGTSGVFGPSVTSSPYTSAVTAGVIEGWLKQPNTNFGWVLDSTGSDVVGFHSSESTTLALRPVLTVTYMP